MTKMPTDKLKRKYYCAVNQHSSFQKAYENSVKSAAKCFAANDLEGMKEHLDFASVMLDAVWECIDDADHTDDRTFYDDAFGSIENTLLCALEWDL